MLARRLLERVLALGGVCRLGETAGAAAAGERLDREEARCKACWLPPAEVGYPPPLLEADTSILAVAGRSPKANNLQVGYGILIAPWEKSSCQCLEIVPGLLRAPVDK